MYGRMGGFDSGLRMGQAIGGIATGVRDSGLRDKALQRIQSGEDYNAVVQEVMQQSPQVAQELLNLRQQNMQAQADEQGIQRTGQLIQIGDMQLERSKLEQSSLPLFMAAMSNDEAEQNAFLSRAAEPFAESNPEVANTIKEIGKQPPEVRMQAITGVIKTLQQVGIYDDPNQLKKAESLTAEMKNFNQWKQLNPEATEQEKQSMFSKLVDPYSRAAATGQAKIETEQGMVPVKAETKTAETRAKTQEDRNQALLQAGIDAADATGTVIDSLNLLNSVETGGFNSAAMAAKRLFGVESADEAELSANLGRAVLSQLKPIFGAAFTAAEGERLERIEASFGKSTAGNKRLLNDLLTINERAAKRALKIAQQNGDDLSVEIIEPVLQQIDEFKKGGKKQEQDPFLPGQQQSGQYKIIEVR